MSCHAVRAFLFFSLLWRKSCFQTLFRVKSSQTWSLLHRPHTHTHTHTHTLIPRWTLSTLLSFVLSWSWESGASWFLVESFAASSKRTSWSVKQTLQLHSAHWSIAVILLIVVNCRDHHISITFYILAYKLDEKHAGFIYNYRAARGWWIYQTELNMETSV